MEDQDYQAIIEDTVDALPKQLRDQLKDVAIVVTDDAPPQKRGILLGLYEGVPLTAWGRGEMNGKPPDKITIFKHSIESIAASPEEIPALVRETLWHEIAHYFGFDHDKIGGMEKRWREKRKEGK